MSGVIQEIRSTYERLKKKFSYYTIVGKKMYLFKKTKGVN
jgi:hypothetical protein